MSCGGFHQLEKNCHYHANRHLTYAWSSFWTDGEDFWYKSVLTNDIHVYDRSAGSDDSTRAITIPWDSIHYTAAGIYGTDSHLYVAGYSQHGTEDNRVYVHDLSTGAYASDTVIVLDPNVTKPWDMFIADGYLYVMEQERERYMPTTYPPERRLPVATCNPTRHLVV